MSWLPRAHCVAAPAFAGLPYLTNDPVPTDLEHWEIYAFTAGEGLQSSIDDDSGLDLNYGALKDVRLTAALPLSFARETGHRWQTGTGDVELGVKYRLLNDPKHGVSAAVSARDLADLDARYPDWSSANYIRPMSEWPSQLAPGDGQKSL